MTILVAVVERQGANDRGNILPLPTKNTDCLENLMLSYPSHNPLGVATPEGFELPDDLPYFNDYFYNHIYKMNQNITLQLSASVSLELIFVQGTGNDTFRMGGTNKDNAPCDVAVADFWIGKYPLTQAQWEAVVGTKKPNPSFYKGKNRPVERVSWDDAIAFINALNEKLKDNPLLKDKKFALPNEAQWEYAARGGVHWRDNFVYAGSNTIREVAWYKDNSHRETKPVGLKLPNQLGIYDMTGNVWEWCRSKYEDYSYRTDDGRNAIDNSRDWHDLRGCCWNDDSSDCAAADWSINHSTGRNGFSGFRLCLLPV